MKIEKVKATPAMMEKWLETVPVFQRRVDPKQVKKIETAIIRGEWRENGATFVFNNKGELIDGQHRAHAIKNAGIPVYTLVVRNVSSGEETFNTIDDSKQRKLQDFIRTKNVNVTSSVIRTYWGVLNHQWPRLHDVPPIPDLLKIGGEHEEYISSLVEPLSAAGRLVGATSFCVFLVFYFTKINPVKDPDRLSQFFARVGDGVELTSNNPAYQLRRRFLGLRGTESLPPKVRLGLILKALNYYMEELTVPRITYDPDREPFPPLAGYDEPNPSTNFVKQIRKKVKLDDSKLIQPPTTE